MFVFQLPSLSCPIGGIPILLLILTCSAASSYSLQNYKCQIAMLQLFQWHSVVSVVIEHKMGQKRQSGYHVLPTTEEVSMILPTPKTENDMLSCFKTFIWVLADYLRFKPVPGS